MVEEVAMVDAILTQNHVERVRMELMQAGATLYGLLKAESRYLPHVIHPDEHVYAVVYGHHNSSLAMLIATDRRVIYLDKKPMATFMDEVTYDVVSGVELDIHTFFATVTLHTAVKNYVMRYVNIHCADKFTSFIEEQRVRKENIPQENHRAEEHHPELTQEQIEKTIQNSLAGYYWITMDEAPLLEEEPEGTKVAY